jgi:UDPglucose 6-dehydrogenase
LKPGPGWGGSCFPRDTIAMVRIAEDHGYDFTFLREVLRVNDEQFDRTAQKVLDALVSQSASDDAAGEAAGRTIGVWGLTFKAGTDDLRMSPAIEVLKRVTAAGVKVKAFDPAVHSSLVELPDVEVVSDAYDAVDGADLLCVMTEWDQFRWLDFDLVKERMSGNCVVDGRNLLDRHQLLRRGFTYRGIGR